jgi:pimeloyl-ACP methyl ester carboxylesterase
MGLSIESWFAGGERLVVRLPGGANGAGVERQIFVRDQGDGPWLTFLHGFPTCSWDWSKIAPVLEADYRLLMFDFLGFGDSDKPRNHDYSLFEQADLTEALWRHFDIQQTGLVAHNYGATVAAELLSRQKEARLAVHLERALLMNAGLYVDLQHPVLAQRLLQKPVIGRWMTYLIGERFFNQQFASIFSPAHPVSTSELQQHWSGLTRRDGVRNYHRLIRYLNERQRHKARWEAALEASSTPLRFVWGLADPVSGRQIAAQIRARLVDPYLVELPEVGHYPQWEAPEVVSSEIQDFF